MKNKHFTIMELQEAINKRLAAFDGRKYKDTEYHRWYAAAIAEEFAERGITEIEPATWRIVTNMSEGGVHFLCDTVAEVKAELKRDKRYTVSAGRGTVVSLRVAFRSDIARFTLDEARRFLLEEKRDEYVMRLKAEREEHARAAEKAAAEIGRLLSLEF